MHKDYLKAARPGQERPDYLSTIALRRSDPSVFREMYAHLRWPAGADSGHRISPNTKFPHLHNGNRQQPEDQNRQQSLDSSGVTPNTCLLHGIARIAPWTITETAILSNRGILVVNPS